jgi:hypothetical protein
VLLDLPAHLVSLVHLEVEVCLELMDLLVLRVSPEIEDQKDFLDPRESKEILVQLVNLDFKAREAHLVDKDLLADKGNFLLPRIIKVFENFHRNMSTAD